MDGDLSTFSVELAAGTDIEAPGPEAMTPLHIAAHRGNVEFAKALLDAGVAIDPINAWGNTPLWVAVMKRRRTSPDGAMIRLLLARGADPRRSEGHISPLDLVQDLAEFPDELMSEIEAAAQK
jgi:ankyrin repeat protein